MRNEEDYTYDFVNKEDEYIFSEIFFYVASNILEFRILGVDFEKKEVKTKLETTGFDEEFFFENLENLGDYDLFYDNLNGETLIDYLERKIPSFDLYKFAYRLFDESIYKDGNLLIQTMVNDIILSKKLNAKINRFEIYKSLHKKYGIN